METLKALHCVQEMITTQENLLLQQTHPVAEQQVAKQLAVARQQVSEEISLKQVL